MPTIANLTANWKCAYIISTNRKYTMAALKLEVYVQQKTIQLEIYRQLQLEISSCREISSTAKVGVLRASHKIFLSLRVKFE
jgi:hypothetical protein